VYLAETVRVAIGVVALMPVIAGSSPFPFAGEIAVARGVVRRAALTSAGGGQANRLKEAGTKRSVRKRKKATAETVGYIMT
jgi:hypothetical protein